MALDISGLTPLDTAGLTAVEDDEKGAGLDVSGLTELDTQGLTPVEEEGSFLGAVGNLGRHVAAGWNELRANQKTVGAIKDLEAVHDPNSTMRHSPLGFDVRRAAKTPEALAQDASGRLREAGELRADAEDVPFSFSTQSMIEAETFGEAWDRFWTNPVTIVSELGARSAAGSALSLGAGVAGGVVGGPAGFAAGMGLGSFKLEQAAGIVGALQEAGVDVTKPEELSAAAANRELMAQVKTRATTKAAIVAGFDALSGGLASKTLAPDMKSKIAEQIVNVPTQMAAQAGLGGAGELVGEYVTTGEVNPGQVAAEMAGEFITAPVDVGAAVLSTRKALREGDVDITKESISDVPNAEEIAEAAKSGQRVRMGEGDEALSGSVVSRKDFEDGSFAVTILGDDGNLYTVTNKDGVSLTGEETAEPETLDMEPGINLDDELGPVEQVPAREQSPEAERMGLQEDDYLNHEPIIDVDYKREIPLLEFLNRPGGVMQMPGPVRGERENKTQEAFEGSFPEYDHTRVNQNREAAAVEKARWRDAMLEPAGTDLPAPTVDAVRAQGLDDRLADGVYRERIKQMAAELVEGGGINYLRDENDRVVGRTPSQNADWFQEWGGELGSVKYVQEVIDRALNGEKLTGTRQQRIVRAMLDAVEDSRAQQTDPDVLAEWESLFDEAQLRASLDPADPTPMDAWVPVPVASLFSDGTNAPLRTIATLWDEALAVGVTQEQLEAIDRESETSEQLAEGIFNAIRQPQGNAETTSVRDNEGRGADTAAPAETAGGLQDLPAEQTDSANPTNPADSADQVSSEFGLQPQTDDKTEQEYPEAVATGEQTDIFSIPPAENTDLVDIAKDAVARLKPLLAELDTKRPEISVPGSRSLRDNLNLVIDGYTRAIEAGVELNNLPTGDVLDAFISRAKEKLAKMQSLEDAKAMDAELEAKRKAREEELKKTGALVKPIKNSDDLMRVWNFSEKDRAALAVVEDYNPDIIKRIVALAEGYRAFANEHGVYDHTQSHLLNPIKDAPAAETGRPYLTYKADQIQGKNKHLLKSRLGKIGAYEKFTLGYESDPTPDLGANEAATSPENDTPAPTEAQIEAGNYKKGHIKVHGLDIAIENPRGSKRSGTDPDGNEWEQELAHHYGYIKRTEGADGEHVDVFVGPKTESDSVFVVDQLNADGSFDEHKVMLGFTSKRAAQVGYRDNYEQGWKVGPITKMSVDEFKAWLKDGDTTKPVSGEIKAPVKSEAPEHAAVGVDDRELGEIVDTFNEAQAGMVEDGDKVTHVFDAPAKSEIVRLQDKVKVYHAEHGWMTPAEAKKRIQEWKDHAADQYDDKKIRSANNDRIVLSLFDLSGKWSQPWADAGYQVYRFDIQEEWFYDDNGVERNAGDIHNFTAEFFGDMFGDFQGNDVYAILAACPCTDFAVSGARHFAAKDADGRTVASVKLVHQTMATIEYFKPAVWAIENPVGRIEKLGGLPPWRLSFDPNHLGEDYTKKTLLWGRFNADLPIAPTEPTEGSKMHKKYGGKSLATKNARSATPEGFSYSFFMANNAHDHPVMAIHGKYDRLDRDLIEQAVKAGVTEKDISSAVDDFYYMDLDDDAANAAIQQLIDGRAADDIAEEKLSSDQKAESERREAAQPEELEVVEHTTKRGKVLRGFVVKDISRDDAQAIDKYTFKKDGGYFIREEYREDVEAFEEARVQDERAEESYTEETGQVEAQDNAELDQSGEGALGDLFAEENSGATPEGRNGAQQGAVSSGSENRGGDGSTAEGRVSGTRGVGNGEGTVSIPATGTGSDGRAGAGGVAGSAPTDFTITEEFDLGKGGEKKKYRDNIAAIQLLKKLESEGRQATSEEQSVLARYVGWGGIPQAFFTNSGKTRKGWEAEAAELKSLLTDEEYSAARRSTQDAHYTSKTVVDAIYSAVSHVGFKSGKILEPSVGTGNFFGLMPPSMRKASTLHAVELDRITGGIAKQLYPSANIKAPMGFQDFKLVDGSYSLAIGNPPFGSQKIYDGSRKAISKFSIHNYFFAKSLDSLHEGGILSMVVSSSLMDKKVSAEREYLASKANLLGAIRLPNTAFKANAGTEVTTDIIFLQKAAPENITDSSWAGAPVEITGADGSSLAINSYFAANPDMMLGQMTSRGSMYRANEPTLEARPGDDLEALLAEAVQKLPADVFVEKVPEPKTVEPVKVEVSSPTEDQRYIKVGSLYFDGDQLVRRLPDNDEGGTSFEPVNTRIDSSGAEKPYNPSQLKRIRGMVDVGVSVSKLLDAQLSGATETQLSQLRSKLNRQYDGFVKKFGHINNTTNRALMRDDPVWPRISALEVDYDKGVSKAVAKRDGVPARNPAARKADIFTKRTQQPHTPVQKVSTSKEGLVVSLSEKGRLDLDYIAKISGKPKDKVIADLGDLIYDDPSDGWVTSEEYLSGNVKDKLKAAKAAADSDARYARNVSALEAVQPADIEPVDINVKLGAPWIPEQVMTDFVDHLAGKQVDVKWTYSAPLAKWTFGVYTSAARLRTQWGSGDMDAVEIMGSLANGKMPRVMKTIMEDGNRKSVLDAEATDAAIAKANELKEEFQDWIWRSAERRETLGSLYNEKYNTTVNRKFDGSHLELPGKVPDDIISLRPHQKNFVWRVLQGGTQLADHVVGAGKTFALIAAGLELRRTGMAKKPMYVVPNHLVQQWSNDFLKLYPNANILVPSKADFSKEGRKRMFARIATGDWDAVIVAHSSFKKLPSEPAEEQAFIEQQIRDLEESLTALKLQVGEKDRTVKESEKARDRLQEKLKELLDATAKDTDNMTFSELGVDALFVDEAHEFKNLSYQTSQGRLPGLGDPSGSQKAQDLFVKTRTVLRNTGGRNVVFATGTPISNSMIEFYTVQRYLGYDELQAKGLSHVDAWINVFGEIVADYELDATSQGYKLQSRLSKFVNMPELMQMYMQFADVVDRDTIAANGARLPIPAIKGGKPENVLIERSTSQSIYMDDIVQRAQNIPPDKSIDNMLKITSDARKAALDMRLVSPEYTGADGSKVDAIVSRVKKIADKWADDKGTQLIFLDLSTPSKANAKEKAKYDALVKKADEGDEQATAELEKYSIDDIIALDGKFSVYDELKIQLTKAGFQDNEVAFIHDATTDDQKDALFAKVRAGDIRVLLGSTQKMGAGMNVQERLVALHHVDAPWRPSDLEQREGRILRQGNALYSKYGDDFEIEILRYATEKTYDARMWQTIETKARFIAQARAGSVDSREVEDISGEAASAAEMKAVASGNPLILEEFQLRAEISKLQNQKKAHDRKQFSITDERKRLERRIEIIPSLIQAAKKDEATLAANEPKSSKANPTGFEVVIAGKKYSKREDAGKAMAVQIASFLKSGKKTLEGVGEYRGFEITLYRNNAETAHILLVGARDYDIILPKLKDFAPNGLAQRLANALSGIPGADKGLAQDLEAAKSDLEEVKASEGEPFKGEDQLRELKARHEAVRKELSSEKKDEKGGDTGDGDEGIAYSRASMVATGATPNGVPIKRAQIEINRFLKQYKGADDVTVKVFRSHEEAHGVPAKFRTKGGYEPTTDTLFIYTGSLDSVADLRETLQHELLVHKGLGFLRPDDIAAFLGAMRAAAKDSPGLQGYLREVDRVEAGRSDIFKAEELLARIAQDRLSLPNKVWNKLVLAVQRLLKALGFNVNVSTYRQARDMIYRFGDAFAEGKRAPRRDTSGVFNQSVYHGTPHQFDRFSLEAIGTGEGAQAFGWGMYFAGKREIAEHYRDNLSDFEVKGFTPSFVRENNDAVGRDALQRVEASQYRVKDAFRSLVDEMSAIEDKDSMEYEWLNSVNARLREWMSYDGDMLEIEDTGNLYQADIPEDADLLDWDAPINEQPQGVQDALNEYVESAGIRENLREVLRGLIANGGRGSAFYGALEAGFGNFEGDPSGAREASHALNDAGIPGLRYRDALSRGDNRKVIFRGNELSVMRNIGAYADDEKAALYLGIYGADKAESMLHFDGFGSAVPALGYITESDITVRDDTAHNYVIWDENRITVEAVNDQQREAEAMFYSRSDREELFDDLDEDQQAFMGKIGPRSLPRRARDRWRALKDNIGLRIRQAGIDRYAALLRNDKALLGEDTLEGSIASSSWVLARMSNSAGGALSAMMSTGRIFYDPQSKIIDVREGTNGLADTFEKLGSPAEIDRFMAWIAANRARKLMEEGRENLFTDEEIEAGLTLNQGRTTDNRARATLYATVWREFQEHRNDVLDIADATGLLRKALDEVEALAAIAIEDGIGLDLVKRMNKAEDAIDRAEDEDEREIAAERHGRIYQELYELVSEEADNFDERIETLMTDQRDLWAEEFYVPFYRVMDEQTSGGPTRSGRGGGLSRQQAYKRLKGGEQHLNDLLENTLLNFHHLLQASLKNRAAQQAMDNATRLGIAVSVSPAERDKKNSTYVLRDGIKSWYDINDPLTFKALSALQDGGLNTPAMRIGRAFKRFFTNMTTITPQFVVANALRDTMSAVATSPVSGNAAKNLVQGAMTFRNDFDKARMMASGGAFSFGHVYGTTPDDIKRSLSGDLQRLDIRSGAQVVPKAIVTAWQKWNDVTNTAENINRAAIWKQNVESDKLKAAFEARDLLDFSAGGEALLVRILTDLVPFMNARLQGLDKLYRVGVKPGAKLMTGQGTAADKRAFGRFATVVGALSLVSMALFLRNKDDEDYEKLEDWQRDTYWFIKIGESAFFIPKPFEVGAIATISERLLEQFIDPNVGGEAFTGYLGRMLTDTFALDPTPQMVKPILELGMNRDTFTDRPIESIGMQLSGMSPSLRTRHDTTNFAKMGSSAMESVFGPDSRATLSPVQIDHLIKGYTGQVGSWVAGTADTVWRTAMGEENPARRWYEYQPIRRFYRNLTDEPAYTRHGTVFYDALKETQRIYADVRELQKRGELEAAGAKVEKFRDKLELRKSMNRVQRRLSEINKRIDEVRRDKTMSGEAKRLELDRLNSIKNALTEEVVDALESRRATGE